MYICPLWVLPRWCIWSDHFPHRSSTASQVDLLCLIYSKQTYLFPMRVRISFLLPFCWVWLIDSANQWTWFVKTVFRCSILVNGWETKLVSSLAGSYGETRLGFSQLRQCYIDGYGVCRFKNVSGGCAVLLINDALGGCNVAVDGFDSFSNNCCRVSIFATIVSWTGWKRQILHGNIG